MEFLKGKRLVVFGCGYVGGALARAAAAAGATVEALTRNPATAAALEADGVGRVLVADLATDAWHGRVAPGPEFLVNCVSSGGGGIEGYRHSYLEGQRSILAWAERGGVPVGTFVYTSSTSVYAQDHGARVDEASPAEGGTPNGRVIRESELLLQAAAAACRRWFILRLAGIYGPGRHHLLDQLRSGAGELGGDGAHRLNLAHRDDIVAAIVRCLGAPGAVGNEVFNVADSGPATREEVVRWLAGRLGRPVPGFSGAATARRGGLPVPDRVIRNEKLQRTLGWRPAYPDFRSGFAAILGG
ncbi:MAG: NAD-dependent epimerase/dehydratase family protein [Opitutaceae bacterium]|nr:NAD-dependent epimerase/dehydratase family protein [Opitutaceae bacterium]